MGGKVYMGGVGAVSVASRWSCYLFLLLGLVFALDIASAAPIYVVNNKDGSVTFTTRAPAPGVTAKVFTARSKKFSLYRGISKHGKRLFSREYHDLIMATAKSFELDPALIKAVIHVESGFDKFALSPKGAMGLMQLMPATAKSVGVRNPYEPSENITGGTKHLAKLLKRYKGNVELSLAAYNAGEDAVESYKGIPPYRETQNYVKAILRLHKEYRTLHG